MGRPRADAENLDEADERNGRYELFRNELVEIFLGGFMHDCGLWTEPYYLQEGHELKGAKLISETSEVQSLAPVLAKTVLLHSDISRLARKFGVVEITEIPDDPGRTSFKGEFYNSIEDAEAAIDFRHGNFTAEVLSEADVRKILPVALAEHYVSHTQDVYNKSHAEVVTELAQHISGGPFLRYMVVLCNSQIDVVAPRRALVQLDGHLTAIVAGKQGARKPERLDITGADAGSLFHGSDR